MQTTSIVFLAWLLAAPALAQAVRFEGLQNLCLSFGSKPAPCLPAGEQYIADPLTQAGACMAYRGMQVQMEQGWDALVADLKLPVHTRQEVIDALVPSGQERPREWPSPLPDTNIVTQVKALILGQVALRFPPAYPISRVLFVFPNGAVVTCEGEEQH